jgi:hypothetical protein
MIASAIFGMPPPDDQARLDLRSGTAGPPLFGRDRRTGGVNRRPMAKKIILFAAAAGLVLATGAPALAQGDPGEGIARGVMHGIEGGDRHRDHDRRHQEHHDRDHHRHRRHDRDRDRGDQHEHDHD